METWFGKWIHGVPAYINFEQKKLRTAALMNTHFWMIEYQSKGH